MKNLKRILSSFLVLVLCLGLIPMTAYADAPYEGNHQGTVTVTVKDSVSQTGIANVVVMLEDITAGREHNYGTKLTDKTGKVSWDNLSSGWYRITQTMISNGYILNSEEIVRYFDTVAQKEMKVDIVNRPKNTLHIYRIDPATNSGLKGADYIVYDSTGAEFAKGTTDENGYLVVPNVPAGDYMIAEVKAPAGYNLSTPDRQAVHVVETGDNPQVTIFTGSEKSSITIFNYDGATGEPIGGSIWKIERANGGTINDHLVTNSSGMVTQDGLEPGTYIVSELRVGPGYISELKHAEVTIGSRTENKVVSLSNIKPGTITVHVGDSVSGKDLAGCVFYLYNERNQVVDGPRQANSTGYVTFENVPDGHYTVVAEPKPGYAMDTTTMQVTIEQGGSKRLDFTATPLGSILIKAVDETQPTKMIPGCEFEVRKQDGTLIGSTYTTGPDGTVTVPALDSGFYVIQETKVPNGYVIESGTKTIYVQAGTVTPVTFSHRDKPYIVAQCFITGTATPIFGSIVHLCNSNGVTILSGTIGADGTYTFEDLEPGTYTVKYASAPDGYSIDTPSQTVVVTKAKAGLATLYASRHSAIVITKLDDANQAPLAGATFVIRDALGTTHDTITTDVSGTAATKVLTPGYYTIHEQFAPDGYVPTTSSRTIEVRNNETSQATFTNKKETAIVVYAYDKDGTPMANVSYILYDVITGREVATKLTDAAGVATFEQLEPGSYMVSESVVPDGYIVVNPTQARVILEAGKPSYVRFVHVPEATIKVETVDIETGKAVSGAVYQITNADGSFTANFTTNDNGEAYTDTLALGTYYVKQIEAPDGYLLNTTTQTITVQRDRVNLAKFFNKPISRIVVECVESGNNFGLTGATITIENAAGKEVARGTTTEDGIYTTGELAPGVYTVKVIASPADYTCIQKQRTVEVTTGLSTTVKFEFTAHNHIIVNLTEASDPSKGLAGSTFRVEAIDSDFECDIVTDSAGHAMTAKLPNGKYMVHQIIAPTGYILDQSYQWATLDSTANTVLDFTNRRISGLTIQALTQADHKGLAGAKFEIWEQNGKLIKTVTTDSTGVVTIDGLPSGIYLVKEVKAPDSYTAVTATQTVTVNFDTPSTMNFYHTAESVLTVNKTDARTGRPLAGATFRLTKSNGDYVGDYTTDASGKISVSTLAAGTYNISETKAPDGYVLDTTSKSFVIKDNQPVVLDITNQPVAGFRIVNTCKQNLKPIAGSVFKISSYDGTLIGNYTTDAGGIINVNLSAGKYTIYQVSVPNGYVKNENVWNITIVDGKNQILEIQNEMLSKVVVHMVDSATNAGIYGVEIEVKEAMTNNYIGRFKSDNEGNIYLTDVLNAGRYTISLLAIPAGYNKDLVPRTIEVKMGQTTEVTWKLQGHQGQVTIVTYSGQDNSMMNIRKNSILSGAVYQITDTTGKVVGTIKGDVNGEAHSGALGTGTYYFQQIVAPVGWQVNTSKFAVNVTSTNDNIRVEVYNLAANYQTTISVGGTATAMAGGNVKYYFNVENKSTSAMDNFFIHMKVPTDGLRAVTLYTGTYTGAATTYSIEYKTNMSDYRTLATGLNSKSNYSYGLSTQALGLQAGEYVTDIRMVFTTVVAGFKSQMAPTLNCYVLSTVMNGYQAIVRGECGAMNGYYSNNSNGGVWGNTTGQSLTQNPGTGISNGWVSASGQFITYLYGYYQNYIPGFLPKTGY